ncbi:MAG: hypothetical protein WCC12_10180 [Anaerolineales bacterium]
MDNTYHAYGGLNVLGRFLMLLLSGVMIGMGLVFLAGLIQALFSNSISSVSGPFWNFIGYAIWSPFVFIFMAYLFSDITANDEGLQTRFLFKNLVVRWEDIAEVKLSRPFGLRVGKRASVLTARNGLTFFHRIYGLVYGQTSQPALVIWSHVSGYDVLTKKISKNRKRKRFPLEKQGKQHE